MKKAEYTRMAELEDSYWWHLGRTNIIKQRLTQHAKLKAKILNIGCGTGGTVPMLEEFGTTYNVDVSDDALAYAKKRGVKNLKKIKGIKLPYKDNYFDYVVAMDVLEHIDEDSKALKEWQRVLKKGGVLILTVPAYDWLWSEHDESLHHQRRYTTSNVHRLANRAGLHVSKRSYIIVFSFPLIVGYRLVRSIFN